MRSNIWWDHHHYYFSSSKTLHLPLLLLKQDVLLFSHFEYWKRTSHDFVYSIFPWKFDCWAVSLSKWLEGKDHSLQHQWNQRKPRPSPPTTVHFCLATHLDNGCRFWVEVTLKSPITLAGEKNKKTANKCNTSYLLHGSSSKLRVKLQFYSNEAAKWVGHLT